MIFLCFSVISHLSCSEKLHRSLPSLPQKDVQQKIIEFSGYKWLVSNSTQPVAPGPNFWSNENIWVDEQGKLHLKLIQNKITGIWSCAELFSQQEFGLGKYEFLVEGAIDKLDNNVVFGLFQYSGEDMHDEIDIEFSQWGNTHNSNLYYSVWPKTGVKALRWTSEKAINLEGTFTTHRITRSASSVKFQSLHGFRNDDQYEFHSATCNRKKIISTQPMPFYLNLWLFKGQPPTDNKEIEIIIHKFSFTPEN